MTELDKSELTEQQMWAVMFLERAIQRLVQEGLTKEGVLFIIVKVSDELAKSVGLQLYIGPSK